MKAANMFKRILPAEPRDRCPKCSAGDVTRAELHKGAFHGYGPVIAVCSRCRSLWEPVHHDLLWDPDDPLCAFSEPCDNCAFRPGSDELKDRKRWAEIKSSLQGTAGFYCHKGVPIEAGAEHGFAYPYTDGKPVVQKMRLCRGWLNAWGANMEKAS